MAGVRGGHEDDGARAAVVGLLAVALAVARDSLARWRPAWWVPIEVGGYAALFALSVVAIQRTELGSEDLGLGPVDPRIRVVGCLVLSAVFALPAVGRALRWERPDGLWLALAAAPVEELLCRGVLFGLVARRWNVATAVGASAVTFAAMHAAAHPARALVAALAAGVVLGTWRALGRDLVAPTVGHLAADVLASIVI